MPRAVAAPPRTQAEPVTETLHAIRTTDPYRWLEDQNSPRIRKWIEEQTACDAQPIHKPAFWHRFDTTVSLYEELFVVAWIQLCRGQAMFSVPSESHG